MIALGAHARPSEPHSKLPRATAWPRVHSVGAARSERGCPGFTDRRVKNEQIGLAAPGDHLRGVLQAGVGDLCAGEHARDFVGAGAIVENANAGMRAAILLALFDGEVLIGEGRNLREVGDAEDLLGAGESLSLWPTASAARPPIPMSISSKTRVRGVVFFFDLVESDLEWEPSSTATFSARRTRESSPPEAISTSGLSGSPGLVEMRYSTSSQPAEVHADS